MKTYSRNVDVLKEFGVNYERWPRSAKAVETIVWMPCVATSVNCEFPDEWKNIVSANGKEIYEMFPLNNAKARARQLSERNKKQIRLVFAHKITAASPCRGADRRYRFMGIFKFDRSDANGVYYKRLDF